MRAPQKTLRHATVMSGFLCWVHLPKSPLWQTHVEIFCHATGNKTRQLHFIIAGPILLVLVFQTRASTTERTSTFLTKAAQKRTALPRWGTTELWLFPASVEFGVDRRHSPVLPVQNVQNDSQGHAVQDMGWVRENDGKSEDETHGKQMRTWR